MTNSIPLATNSTHYFHISGVLLLLNIPDELHFGIDNMLWKVGKKFKGIKFIPYGVHIICYGLGKENEMFKLARFVVFEEKKSIVVMRWDRNIEYFYEVNGEEAEGYRSGVRQYHFDSFLGVYPNENIGFWQQNTNFITKEVLGKLDPIDRMIKFSEEYSREQRKSEEQEIKEALQDMNIGDLDEQHFEDNLSEEEEQEQYEETNLNKLTKKKEPMTDFHNLIDTTYYSDIPRFLAQAHSPSEITNNNLNKTVILERVIAKEWEGKCECLLGELQYSFVHFLIGEAEESFQQWKKVVNLLVYSEKIYMGLRMKGTVDLVNEFIVVFYEQLQQFPKDFFVDELSKDSFIADSLKRLYSYISESSTISKTRKRLLALFEMVSTRFNYIPNDDLSEEELPVVVDEGEHYF